MSQRTIHTIGDIARLANVSKSTVSRALNDSPLISQETKERIRAIAQKANFHLNFPARQLSLKQSRTIAFVVHPFDNDFSIADLFVLEILGSISNGLAAQGYDLLIVHAHPHETGWIDQYLDSARVDGFILFASSWRLLQIRALMEKNAPFIVWGAPPSEYPVCSVSGDNFTGGKLATGHLLRTGKRRIAFLGGPAEEPEIQQRYQGYAAAFREAGRAVDPRLVIHENYADISSPAAALRLLERAPDLDGIFAYSDFKASVAIKAIRERGLRTPEDIAVVGYDDLSIAEFSNPSLTTIRQNIPLAGKLLAQNLIRFLQTGEVTHVTLPVTLIVRQSA